MTRSKRLLLGCLVLVSGAALGGEPPGPVADELYISTYEGVGAARGFTTVTGLVVPASDGLPVLLQADNSMLYLAKCRRLDCATGVDRTEIGSALRGAELGLNGAGIPIFVYYDSALNSMRLGTCDDASCATWSAQTLVAGQAINNRIVAKPSSNPLIAIQGSFGGFDQTLLVFRCAEPDCATAPSRVDITSNEFDVRIAIPEDDLPLIVWTEFDNAAPSGNSRLIRVLKCEFADCSGSTDTQIINITDVFRGGLGRVLSPPGGNPLIVTLALDDLGLNFVAIECLTPDCSSFAEPTILGEGINITYAGVDAGLSSEGFPVFAFIGNSVGTGELVRCTDVNCSGPQISNRLTRLNSSANAPHVFAPIGGDGNPIIGFDRAFQHSFGILHCRDLACNDTRAY